MAILHRPKGTDTKLLVCALCDQQLVFANAVVGPRNNVDEQVFWCDEHLATREELLRSVISYALKLQKQKPLAECSRE